MKSEFFYRAENRIRVISRPTHCFQFIHTYCHNKQITHLYSVAVGAVHLLCTYVCAYDAGYKVL